MIALFHDIYTSIDTTALPFSIQDEKFNFFWFSWSFTLSISYYDSEHIMIFLFYLTWFIK